MGGRGSKAVKKITSVLTGASDEGETSDDTTLARFRGASPFVFTRRSSMYIDEDGDVAHEFYEEIRPFDESRGKCRLRRMYDNLRPQGQVAHPFPRLNPNMPVIMCEN